MATHTQPRSAEGAARPDPPEGRKNGAPGAPSAPRKIDPAKTWLVVLSALLIVVLVGGGLFWWRAQHMEEPIRQWVVRSLSAHFKSRVELGSVHIAAFPHMGATAEDLTVYFHDRTDVPPLIHINRVSFGLGLMSVLRFPTYVSTATVENMTITIPPRDENAPQKKEGPPMTLVASVVVGEIFCKNAVIITLPRPEPGKPLKEPLEWEIHNLTLHNMALDKSFAYEGTLTNAKPKGEIATTGTFGPFDVDEPGESPVTGKYVFSHADLDPFPGINGTLSSTGQFEGILAELQVEGVTDTPDFSLDRIGKPVPLHTEYAATVDGTNGDTRLHPVRATLVESLILAEGSIINVPKKGHTIRLTFGAPHARIQDLLALAVNADRPFLTGPVKINGKLAIPPGDEKALEKMVLDGSFGIDDARWTSPEMREKLESLSRRGEGKPKDEDAGSAISDITGTFHMDKGVVHFSSLTFSVPGAAVDLAGSYKILPGNLDFKGHVKLDAKLSQTVTGVKSFFLKALDPLFEKDGAGTEIPIEIGGTYQQPTFTVVVLHKKIEKQAAMPKGSSRRK